MRLHVILADDLVQQVDDLTGPRGRSEYIEKAVREKLRHDRLDWALEHGAGLLKGRTPEHWSTPEKTYRWVREMRETDSKRLDEKLRSVPDER